MKRSATALAVPDTGGRLKKNADLTFN